MTYVSVCGTGNREVGILVNGWVTSEIDYSIEVGYRRVMRCSGYSECTGGKNLFRMYNKASHKTAWRCRMTDVLYTGEVGLLQQAKRRPMPC